MQFAALPVPVELVPALGADAVLSMASQAGMFGGVDCVLLHPEYLKDRSSNGVVARLKASGNRVAAFGWAQVCAVAMGEAQPYPFHQLQSPC